MYILQRCLFHVNMPITFEVQVFYVMLEPFAKFFCALENILCGSINVDEFDNLKMQNLRKRLFVGNIKKCSLLLKPKFTVTH